MTSIQRIGYINDFNNWKLSVFQFKEKKKKSNRHKNVSDRKLRELQLKRKNQFNEINYVVWKVSERCLIDDKECADRFRFSFNFVPDNIESIMKPNIRERINERGRKIPNAKEEKKKAKITKTVDTYKK